MKRKILLNTNYSLLKTGFGRAALCILKYLYATNKYELVHLCAGMPENDPALSRTPWKNLPAFRSHQDVAQIQDARLQQLTVYGAMALDHAVATEKPFAVLLLEDFWAFNCFDAPWFKKLHSVVWTTLDSLPLLSQAIEQAPKIDNYWLWSDFAANKLNSLGFPQAKTVYGPIDSTPFYKLSDKEKLDLKNKFNIPQDAFIVGFFFRNQLRKLVPNTLAGWKMFKEQNNIKNGYLLFHTHFSEAPGNSWDIPRLMNEYEISPNEVLVTHICRQCKDYTVQPFLGQGKKCSCCGAEGEQGLVTTSPNLGVTEKQLNEVYNLCSMYLHCMTSGGLEYPLIEAKLCELITATVPYSCGETFTVSEAQSLSIDYAEYREVGTHFIKASPFPSSICKQLLKVYNMKPEKRAEMGQKARQWALERFDIKVIGKFIENFIDSLPDIDYDYKWDYQPRNPSFIVPEIEDDTEWLRIMYKNILLMDEPGSGLEYWLNELKKGIKRSDIEQFFRKTAADENSKNQKIDFKDTLGPESPDERFLVVLPESAGDITLATSLFKSFKQLYPKHKFYFACKPQFKTILEGNKYVDYVIDFQPFMENTLLMEGFGAIPKVFDMVFLLHVGTQRLIDYLHNSHDKSAVDFNDVNLPQDGEKTPICT